MDDAPDSVDGDAPARTEATSRPRSGLRSLDRRTIAICACIALIAALVAGLIASMVVDRGGGSGDSPSMTLEDAGSIDTARLLAQPLDQPDGAKTKLGAYLEDQPMLVNIWASNCSPCRREMPLLQQAADANPDITFVGVATQDRPAAAQAFARDKIDYPWLLDPTGELLYEAKGAGMPTTLLLSADGTVLGSHTGKFADAAQLRAFLAKAG